MDAAAAQLSTITSALKSRRFSIAVRWAGIRDCEDLLERHDMVKPLPVVGELRVVPRDGVVRPAIMLKHVVSVRPWDQRQVNGR